MFDIGFSELIVIGLVALIVIGPERLPRVARTLGHLVGRLQRYVADVKADINREIEMEELKKMRESVQQTASGIESSVQAELNQAESELNRAVEAVTGDPAQPASSPAPAVAQSQEVSRVPEGSQAPEVSHAPAEPAHAIGEKPEPSKTPLAAVEKQG